MAAWGVETFATDKHYADIIRSMKVKTVREYTEIVAQRNEFVRSFDEQVRQLFMYTATSLTSIVLGVGQIRSRRNYRTCSSLTAVASWVGHGFELLRSHIYFKITGVVTILLPWELPLVFITF
jgi:hypothetical protein